MCFAMAAWIPIVIVSNIFRESANLKNRRLIHVIPKTVDLRCAHKLIITVKGLPVLLSILVQIIYPNRSSRPAVTLELGTEAVMHKNLGSFIFKGGSLFVDEIPTCNFDVRVGDCNQSPLMI